MSDAPAVNHCRSCGAAITWHRSAEGKAVPVSVATGENHFRDCPDAAGWSKPRKPKPAAQDVELPW